MIVFFGDFLNSSIVSLVQLNQEIGFPLLVNSDFSVYTLYLGVIRRNREIHFRGDPGREYREDEKRGKDSRNDDWGGDAYQQFHFGDDQHPCGHAEYDYHIGYQSRVPPASLRKLQIEERLQVVVHGFTPLLIFIAHLKPTDFDEVASTLKPLR